MRKLHANIIRFYMGPEHSWVLVAEAILEAILNRHRGTIVFPV